jgi:hypothetical protein
VIFQASVCNMYFNISQGFLGNGSVILVPVFVLVMTFVFQLSAHMIATLNYVLYGERMIISLKKK